MSVTPPRRPRTNAERIGRPSARAFVPRPRQSRRRRRTGAFRMPRNNGRERGHVGSGVATGDQALRRHAGDPRGSDLSIEDGEFCVLRSAPRAAGNPPPPAHGRRAGGHLRGPHFHRWARRDTASTRQNAAWRWCFQTYALYPHMTVEENMGFGLKMTGPSQGRDQGPRSTEAARVLKLGDYLTRKPKALSGWPAPARRHRSRHRAWPRGVPVRTSRSRT